MLDLQTVLRWLQGPIERQLQPQSWTCQCTDMSVAKHITLNAELKLLQPFVTAVGNVDIDEDACAADPNLAMEASCDLDALKLTRFGIDKLIVCS